MPWDVPRVWIAWASAMAKGNDQGGAEDHDGGAEETALEVAFAEEVVSEQDADEGRELEQGEGVTDRHPFEGEEGHDLHDAGGDGECSEGGQLGTLIPPGGGESSAELEGEGQSCQWTAEQAPAGEDREGRGQVQGAFEEDGFGC